MGRGAGSASNVCYTPFGLRAFQFQCLIPCVFASPSLCLYSHKKISYFPKAGGAPSTFKREPYAGPSKPVPLGYICYRCGKSGEHTISVPRTWSDVGSDHWIHDCPTNEDPNFNNKPRIKRTTGIPKSFLQTVEGPTAENQAGLMVTSDGGFVVARPDS